MSEQFSGRLEVFGLADLLQWMELNRRSGRMTLTQGKDRRILDWKEGQIVYVSGSLPRHRLAAHLLRTGAFPARTLYCLLARNFSTDQSLTRLILEGGHDTLDGLSLRVEELARRLLLEMFEWGHGHFEYDPDYQVQAILRIRLNLRGQPLAFQGVKKLDDRRRRPNAESLEEAAGWERPFQPTGADERFWEALARVGSHVDPEEARKKSEAVWEFAQKLRSRLLQPVALQPVYEETANMLAELLTKSPFDSSAIVPIAALDPYLTLDLLILANSLSVDRDNAVGTVPDALERLGARAATVLIDGVSAPDFPRIPDSDRAALALRRAAVAAAVAAGNYAERYGISRERGYTLGLLHALAYADLFDAVREMDFPAGPFRAAVLEIYRQPAGQVRAEAWNLPLDFQAVLSDDGSDPSAAAALVRIARSALPDCALGSFPLEEADPFWAEGIKVEVNMLFDFLGFQPVEKTTA